MSWFKPKGRTKTVVREGLTTAPVSQYTHPDPDTDAVDTTDLTPEQLAMEKLKVDYLDKQKCIAEASAKAREASLERERLCGETPSGHVWRSSATYTQICVGCSKYQVTDALS